jgi:lipoprotein-anchoring transpeptidase ErfK/SrfK
VPPAASPAPSAPASFVAHASSKFVAVYRSPKSQKPFTWLKSPNADGAPLTFLVKKRIAGWSLVHLPMRPNGSLGWVQDAAVWLARDPYRVEISVRHHRFTVYNGRHAFMRGPVGVGRSTLPTPTGTYFLVALLRQPDPRGPYGPYAFGTSAYSRVLYSFGGGPGQIGLHGTNEPRKLGTDVSHGCLRISNAAITRLARLLPLGTPIVISK